MTLRLIINLRNSRISRTGRIRDRCRNSLVGRTAEHQPLSEHSCWKISFKLFIEKPFNLRLSTDYPKRALAAYMDTEVIAMWKWANQKGPAFMHRLASIYARTCQLVERRQEEDPGREAYLAVLVTRTKSEGLILPEFCSISGASVSCTRQERFRTLLAKLPST